MNLLKVEDDWQIKAAIILPQYQLHDPLGAASAAWHRPDEGL